MSQAEIEFTADGKFITRVPGKEPDIKNYFFDEKQNILLVTIEGKEDRNEVTFTGNKMILKGAEATVGFQRK